MSTSLDPVPPAIHYGAVRPGDVERGAVPLREAGEEEVYPSSRHGKSQHPLFGHTSHFWIEESEIYTGQHTTELKSEFIRKVYSILCGQMLLTVMVSVYAMTLGSSFVLEHSSALVIVSTVSTFSCLLALMWKKDVYPTNFWVLGVFTVFESMSIGIVCAIYQSAGFGDVIVNAFAITGMVFFALTMLAMQTKIDFTPYLGLLTGLLVSLLVVGLISSLFGFTMGLLYSWFGAAIFCCFIVVDTQLIMRRFGYDDYIVAAIELYLDILNLFLFLVRILTPGSSSGGRNR